MAKRPRVSSTKAQARGRVNNSQEAASSGKGSKPRRGTSDAIVSHEKQRAAPLPREPSSHPHTEALLRLRQFGLRYPEAHLKSPWPGHLDLAVREKIFVHLSVEGEPLRLSCKLPQSCSNALTLPFAEPTGYGLGKSGWVTATFGVDETPPVEFLELWIDESYRAVAPKTLVKRLEPR